MPAEVFGQNYEFLPRAEILSFEEIERTARALVPTGVRKLRLTGGEPLLRRGLSDLVGLLAAVEGIEDLAMTTNGVLLAHHAEELALAGLSRVTVSLDALDPEIFGKMNGVGAKVDRVLTGIRAARLHGLPVKVNSVIQRGVNESEILPLLDFARREDVVLRFVEYMDVGETNGWKTTEVVKEDEILELIRTRDEVHPVERAHPADVASRFRIAGPEQEFGVISSISKPFCGDCQRLRLSADGSLYTCLFASAGHDLKSVLRSTDDDERLRELVNSIWTQRNDRYSELRGKTDQGKAEMSYLGG